MSYFACEFLRRGPCIISSRFVNLLLGRDGRLECNRFISVDLTERSEDASFRKPPTTALWPCRRVDELHCVYCLLAAAVTECQSSFGLTAYNHATTSRSCRQPDYLSFSSSDDSQHSLNDIRLKFRHKSHPNREYHPKSWI